MTHDCAEHIQYPKPYTITNTLGNGFPSCVDSLGNFDDEFHKSYLIPSQIIHKSSAKCMYFE